MSRRLRPHPFTLHAFRIDKAFNFTSEFVNTTTGDLARRVVALGNTRLVLAADVPRLGSEVMGGAQRLSKPQSKLLLAEAT